MKWNRNHWCTLGFFVLLLGIQFYLIDSVTFTPDATEFIAEATNNKAIATRNGLEAMTGVEAPVRPHTWFPQDQVQHTLLTAGFVLVFTSLAMRKP